MSPQTARTDTKLLAQALHELARLIESGGAIIESGEETFEATWPTHLHHAAGLCPLRDHGQCEAMQRMYPDDWRYKFTFLLHHRLVWDVTNALPEGR